MVQLLLVLLAACGRPPPDATDTATTAMEVIQIPGGTFQMGCDPARDPDCKSDELPAHAVTLSPFGMDRYEVTQGVWQSCVDESRCTSPATSLGDDPDLPVVGVTFAQAQALCDWRDMRLPTEAEWEYGARGTDGRIYPWGDQAPDCTRAWLRSCGDGLAPVGSHPTGASPWGIEDLTGNAWEWLADLYTDDWYLQSPSQDPTGPTSSGQRGVRGVSTWSDSPTHRASNREFGIDGMHCPTCGLRCVQDGGTP